MSTATSPRDSTAPVSAPTQASLPAAHLFDILPPLHALLSRLEPNHQSLNPSGPPTEGPENSSNAPLSYKDIGNQSQFLKARIRKAMAECAKLGDMDRSLNQQEREMVQLEIKIARQREVLKSLGQMAGGIEADLAQKTQETG